MVITGPSGSGKSTVIREILRKRPQAVLSVSHTTRPKRNYEQDGVHYYFTTRERFLEWAKSSRLLEWEEVHGELYGTDREAVERELDAGKTVIFDIDVKGGESIKSHYPETILIFLYAPSLEELRSRLSHRGTDTPEAIEKRLSRYEFEKVWGDKYPHRILNRDLEQTVAEILKLMDSKINLRKQ